MQWPGQQPGPKPGAFHRFLQRRCLPQERSAGSLVPELLGPEETRGPRRLHPSRPRAEPKTRGSQRGGGWGSRPRALAAPAGRDSARRGPAHSGHAHLSPAPRSPPTPPGVPSPLRGQRRREGGAVPRVTPLPPGPMGAARGARGRGQQWRAVMSGRAAARERERSGAGGGCGTGTGGTGGTGRAGGRGTGQSRPGGLSAGLGSAPRGRRRSPVLVTGGCSSPLPGGARGSAGAAAAGPGRAGSCGPCPLSPGGFRPLAPHRGPPRCLPGLREEARAAARLPTCRVLDGAVCAEPQSPAERFFPLCFR